MKKILLTSIAVAACGINAFGSGIVLFENIDNSSYASVTLNSSTGPPTGSGLVVDLFWDNGSSFVLEDTFTSTFTGAGSLGSGNVFQAPGEFEAGEVTIPQSGTQFFEVEGFYTSGTIAYAGTTGPFLAYAAPAGQPIPPQPIASLWPPGPGDWDGNLVLIPVPEPSAIALGGLGATSLLLFRRRK
jgi:PEP-CTERM motif